jgi:hypothetical protein
LGYRINFWATVIYSAIRRIGLGYQSRSRLQPRSQLPRNLFAQEQYALIRKRIVAAVAGGASRRAAAARFAVSESAAIKLVQRWERTGSLDPGRWAVIGPLP